MNQCTAIANPDAVGLRGSATSRDNIVAPWIPWHYALATDNADGDALTFAEIMAVVNPPGTNTPDIVSTSVGAAHAHPS
ncbi:MAG: hypothetical protein ACOX9C_07305 [Kiritimatiellia bacterium]